jgi:sirohydrochlorin ferrochelatase
VSGPPLVAVAHGSRDAAAQRTVEALLGVVRARRPDLDVRAAYVQNASPDLPSALAAAGPFAGRRAVVVPLLLSRGYHVAVDIARAAETADAVVALPLGPDELLARALADRLNEAGVPTSAPVVLAAAGSTDPAAAADVEAQARLLTRRRRAPVVSAHATAGHPSIDEALVGLLRRTAGPVAVAPYLLAPGHFAAVVRSVSRRAGAMRIAAPLGAHPALAELVLERYDSVAARSRAAVG